MPSSATTRQKQFLRCLGHKDVANLSKQQGSQLIDKLLAEEKASGKTFPCPYCKARFGPRPRRQTKCKSCGNNIIHLSGKFYTSKKVDELNQKVWLNDTRKDRNADIKDEWREERQYRKEFGEPMFVGYMVKAGPNCPHAKDHEGLLVLIEDACDTPDFLPPYDECRHDSCECEYDSVTAKEVPRKTRIAEWEDPAKRAKLKTRNKSPVSIQKKKAGCATLVMSACAFAASVCAILAVIYAG